MTTLNHFRFVKETLRYHEIGVRVTGSIMFFLFHSAMTSSILSGRPSLFSGVGTSLPVEELRVATDGETSEFLTSPYFLNREHS